eukprot:758726-Hanusia_phi.AAC.2
MVAGRRGAGQQLAQPPSSIASRLRFRSCPQSDAADSLPQPALQSPRLRPGARRAVPGGGVGL